MNNKMIINFNLARILIGKYESNFLAVSIASSSVSVTILAIPAFALKLLSEQSPVVLIESLASFVIITKSADVADKAEVPRQVPSFTEICGTTPDKLEIAFRILPYDDKISLSLIFPTTFGKILDSTTCVFAYKCRITCLNY